MRIFWWSMSAYELEVSNASFVLRALFVGSPQNCGVMWCGVWTSSVDCNKISCAQ